ncbi:MAG TPA: amidohydrolase family protein, partial [Vicinamibacterales bacterium]
VLYGESVYGPLHDPMFDSISDPKPEQLAQWRRLAMEIAKNRLPLHVHAELTHTIDAFLDQIEAVNKVYPVKNLRWMLAHFNQSNASQLERMKRLGMYAAVHPWNVINGGIMHEIFGDDSYEQPPLATIQASGIMWGFGSDGSAANQYMPFITLSYAVTVTPGSTPPVESVMVPVRTASCANTAVGKARVRAARSTRRASPVIVPPWRAGLKTRPYTTW